MFVTGGRSDICDSVAPSFAPEMSPPLHRHSTKADYHVYCVIVWRQKSDAMFEKPFEHCRKKNVLYTFSTYTHSI